MPSDGGGGRRWMGILLFTPRAADLWPGLEAAEEGGQCSEGLSRQLQEHRSSAQLANARAHLMYANKHSIIHYPAGCHLVPHAYRCSAR